MDIQALLQSSDLAVAIKNIVAVAALFGVSIELTPFIKLNPVSWAVKRLGRAINDETLKAVKELKSKTESLEKSFTEKQIDDLRWNILDFANSCRNHRKHSKEEFDHVIAAHKDYMEILRANKMENGQVDADFRYILEIYNECMHENSFL